MSSSLPLPNTLMAANAPSASATKPVAGAAARSTPADGSPTFKQSLQRLETNPAQQKSAATDRGPTDRGPTDRGPTVARGQQEAADGADVPTIASEEAVVSPYGHHHEFRQLSPGAASGLSFLARLAEGVAGKTEATEETGEFLAIDPALVDVLSPLVGSPSLTATENAMTDGAVMAGVLSPGFSANPSHGLAVPAAVGGLTLTPVSEPDGKSLPPLAVVGLNSASVVQASATSPAVSQAVLDAAAASLTASPGDLKPAGSDFKALLLQSVAAADSLAGQTPTPIDDNEPASLLTSSVLANAPTPTLQLEGRTAIPITVAFGQAQWSAALAERTAWLAGQSIQSAEIQLDPPELGPLQVRIQVNQDQASVSFVSANPAVREAVEQTMNRLRELFQEQGMTLVDSGVSDQQPRQQQGTGDSHDAGAGTATAEDTSVVDPSLQTLVVPQPWGVDIEV